MTYDKSLAPSSTSPFDKWHSARISLKRDERGIIIIALDTDSIHSSCFFLERASSASFILFSASSINCNFFF